MTTYTYNVYIGETFIVQYREQLSNEMWLCIRTSTSNPLFEILTLISFDQRACLSVL